MVVVDPLPLYRRGVTAVMSAAGYIVEAPADVSTWLHQRLRAVVLLTLDSEQAWQLLQSLRNRSAQQLVIALVPGASAAAGVRAIRVGAHAVVPRAATPEALLRAVEIAIDGQTVMPAAVASALAAGVHVPDSPKQPLSPTQLSWLRQLAAGATVAQLAANADYSERAMFRKLQATYQAMGARTRIEALIRAHEDGWLDINQVASASPRGRRRSP